MQIQFDCSSLANNNMYLSYSEAYFQFPILITAKGTATNYSTTLNAFSLGLKNGYYQFIDSMQVDLNNQNICQLQNNLNMLVNYKLLTSMSQDELDKLGPILGFYPDSSDSYTYSTISSADGIGYCNNRNNTPSDVFTVRADSNTGFYKRQKDTVGNSTEINTLATITGTSVNEREATYKAEGRNYYKAEGNGGTWVIIATLRLKDLSDFFDKAPISRGLSLRFTININTFTATFSTVAAVVSPPAAATLSCTSYTQLSGHTCPIMIASCYDNNSNSAITTGTDLVVTCNIGSLSSTNIKPAISTTRLYVPAYRLDPDYATSYIKDTSVSTIRYYDYYTYTTDVGESGTFNTILTNGILNPKCLVIMPFIKNTSTNVGSLNLNQFQSPFDSAGGTTAPEVSIINFQCMLAGSNVFNNIEQYSYSQFLDEFQHLFAINGSNTTGINSGLIGKYQWDNAYRFYVCDLSRRIKFEDKIPKSVQIEGTNNTKLPMSYVCFLLFERSITLNANTGEIITSVP